MFVCSCNYYWVYRHTVYDTYSALSGTKMVNLHNTRNAFGISLVLQVIFVTINGHKNDGCIHFRTEMTHVSFPVR